MKSLFQNVKKYQFYAVVIFLAVIVRIAYLHNFMADKLLQIPILDAAYYLRWAQAIINHGWLGDRVFFTEPLYAYLLAYILKLGGSANLLLGIQFICGALLPIVVYQIGILLFRQPIARIAAVITAIFGPFVFYESLLIKTSLEVFLVSVFVLVILNSLRYKKIPLFLISGLILGLTVLTKGNSIVFVPAVVTFISFSKDLPMRNRVVYSSLFISGFLLIVLPITLRNYVVEHDFVLTNYSFGMNIYQGNWWDSDGSLLQPFFIQPDPEHEEIDSRLMAQAYNKNELKPSQTSAFWIRKAISEIVAKPSHWLWLLKQKVILFITPIELSDNYDYGFFASRIPILTVLPNFLLISVLSLFTGVLLFSAAFRREIVSDKEQHFKMQSFLLILIGSYILVLFAGHVNSRYRLPVIPFLILLASVAVYYLYLLVKRSAWGSISKCLVVLFCVVLLVTVHLQNFDFITQANYYNNVGSYYLDNKQYGKAYMYFDKAIQEDDSYSWGYANLFKIYMLYNERVLAKESLQKAISLRPDDAGVYNQLEFLEQTKDLPYPAVYTRIRQREKLANVHNVNMYDADFYEGMRYIKYGQIDTAKKYFERSDTLHASPGNTLLMLSSLAKVRHDTVTAKEYLETAIRKNKYFLPAYYNLANIYIQEGNHEQAVKNLQYVYDYVPEYGETWVYLIAEQLRVGKFESAKPLIDGYFKQYATNGQKMDELRKMVKISSR